MNRTIYKIIALVNDKEEEVGQAYNKGNAYLMAKSQLQMYKAVKVMQGFTRVYALNTWQNKEQQEQQ